MITDTTVVRILSTLFYYPPHTENYQTILPLLPQLPQLTQWSKPDLVSELCYQLSPPDIDALCYQFSVLFEGQGKMSCPPWGSIYLATDNLLMGDSTIVFRHFLAKHQLILQSTINGPEDQFGLMLLAFCALIESQQLKAASQLLSNHLLPWSPRYLELLSLNTYSHFYALLAKITQYYCDDLIDTFTITPRQLKIYF